MFGTHSIDSNSGARVFNRSPLAGLSENAAALQAKLDSQQALMKALIDALPKSTKDKIPAELLEALNGSDSP